MVFQMKIQCILDEKVRQQKVYYKALQNTFSESRRTLADQSAVFGKLASKNKSKIRIHFGG